ncbi:hypothetical protein WJX73_010833 [Symbiochloris irregularis]|uniref:Ubiquinol-cytochrome c chaperone domain-containing protein n=1 Tax=Symbiochloris irregularis TaxID=706552 RepID=A0AAW1NJ92_9CHLO
MFRSCAREASRQVLASRTLLGSSAAGRDLQWGAVGLQYALYASASTSNDFKTAISSLRAQSLAHQRETDRPTAEAQSTFWSRALLRLGGFHTKEAQRIRAARCLHECVLEQGMNPRLHEAVKLGTTFAQQYAVMCIHVWLLLVRLRAEGDEGKELAQMVYENFTDKVEELVHKQGVVVRVSKHLKELETIFYGNCLSYEKGMAGEEDLQTAVLRNIYAGDEKHRSDAAALCHYMKRELACLSMTDSEAVLAGQIKFSQNLWGPDGHRSAPPPSSTARPAAASQVEASVGAQIPT